MPTQLLKVFAAALVFVMVFVVYYVLQIPFLKYHIIDIKNSTQKNLQVRMKVLDKESGGETSFSDPVEGGNSIEPNKKAQFRFELDDVSSCLAIEFLEKEKVFYSYACDVAGDSLEGDFRYDVEIKDSPEAKIKADQESAQVKESRGYVSFLSVI